MTKMFIKKWISCERKHYKPISCISIFFKKAGPTERILSLLVCMNPRETTLYTRDSNESHFARKQSPLSFFRGRTLICLSHLRWDFVFQRPQHLMTRFAQVMPVFFIEEQIFEKRRDLGCSFAQFPKT